ncbi:MAG: ABC transporter ATP-binding protein [Dehalococcoidales bacterium]|jgi:iron complex transport system ATP-binding protein|nr:ABC transporter ATP-binding protein [Dehalococcoidales bacterium]NLT28352.1 ABC transporter ATP-binding protein [Dehalococcoidales bacterium]
MQKLSLKNVTLGYGETIVLSGIDIEILSGEVIGIVGPNGCGKSTLIKGITRVIPLKGGDILLNEKSIKGISQNDIARTVAVVPQSAVLPEAFTAFEIVLMGRTPHMKFLEYEGQKDVDIAVKAMKMTDTIHLAQRRAGELSGGEKQRLTIARALAQKPGIILLDEPTSHLDINYQIETLELISELCKKEGWAVLAALHDLNLAAQYCERIIMLNKGRIFNEGTPCEVVTAVNVKRVYGADVCISSHPVNRLPVTLVTGNRWHNGN